MSPEPTVERPVPPEGEALPKDRLVGHEGGLLSPADDAGQDEVLPGTVPGTLDSRG